MQSKRYLLAFLALIFLASFGLAWWNTDWDYRVPITVTETSGSTLTDYQVLVTVDTATLITDGKVNSDCSDIRFIDENDATELSYWIEPDTCNTANTRIWVKVPSIPASSSKTIYMYYGNPTATSASDGDAVFLFFDDFEGGSLDTSKWSTVVSSSNPGTIEVNNGKLELTPDTSASSANAVVAETKWSFTTQEVVIEMLNMIYPSSYTDIYVTPNTVTSSGVDTWHFYNSYYGGGSTTQQIDTSNFGDWTAHFEDSSTSDSTTWKHPVSVPVSLTETKIVYTASTVKTRWILADGTDSGWYSASVSSYQNDNKYIAIWQGTYPTVPTGTLSVDTILVRKYASSEPTTSVGSEETAGEGPSVTIQASHTIVTLDPDNEPSYDFITFTYEVHNNATNVANVSWHFVGNSTWNAVDPDGTDVYLYGDSVKLEYADYWLYDDVMAGTTQYPVNINVTFEDGASVTDEMYITVRLYPHYLAISYEPKLPFTNESITFIGNAEDEGTVSYSWDFGDGATATGDTVTHAFATSGSFVVTMTVTDNDGLSKSKKITVNIYTEPVVQWSPSQPHADEPATFSISADERLTVVNTSWYFENATISSETNTEATVIFDTHGNKTVSANIVVSDGANNKTYSWNATVEVQYIKLTLEIRDENTGNLFDMSKGSFTVWWYNGTETLISQSITSNTKEFDFDSFPTSITLSVAFGSVTYLRQQLVDQHKYENTYAFYMTNLNGTNYQIIQSLFTPTSDVVVRVKDGTKIITEGYPDLSGSFSAFLQKGKAYTISYLCTPESEEHVIGVYTAMTSQQTGIYTQCGQEATQQTAYPYINLDTNLTTEYLKITYTDTTNTTNSVNVSVTVDGQVVYAGSSDQPTAVFTYYYPSEYENKTFRVDITAHSTKLGTVRLTRYVGKTGVFMFDWIPQDAYPWFVIVLALFLLFLGGAAHSRITAIAAMVWVAISVALGWLPIMMAIPLFAAFVLVMTWKVEGGIG